MITETGLIPISTTTTLAPPRLGGEEVIRSVAGLRPFRAGSYRLEAEWLGDMLVVHNYGHGGAGITLSWGCAEEVLTLLGGQAGPVAVIGSGILGLTAATRLVESGFAVTVYAKAFPPHTVSDIGGGQWNPASVDVDRSPAGQAQFRRILTSGLARFRALLGKCYGVVERTNFVAEGNTAFLDIPAGILSPPEMLPRLPFEDVTVPGRAHHTLLVQTPILLPRLMEDLRAAGARLVERTFTDSTSVRALPEKIVVNCLGLGAGQVFADPAVKPVRGQLLLLKPQDCCWMLSFPGGYLFPREDAVVLGGTYETDVADATPQTLDCNAILNRHRAFFKLPPV
jgi:D-amino-acid oxidase